MSISAIQFSKPVIQFLMKYGPSVLDGLPRVWEMIQGILNKEAQKQLADTIQALETAVRQRKFYRNLSWILGSIAVINLAIAMWAMGRFK